MGKDLQFFDGSLFNTASINEFTHYYFDNAVELNFPLLYFVSAVELSLCIHNKPAYILIARKLTTLQFANQQLKCLTVLAVMKIRTDQVGNYCDKLFDVLLWRNLPQAVSIEIGIAVQVSITHNYLTVLTDEQIVSIEERLNPEVLKMGQSIKSPVNYHPYLTLLKHFAQRVPLFNFLS